MSDVVVFGLAPSPSHAAARAHAPVLEASIRMHLENVTVRVSPTYGALGDELLSGAVHMAWAPPIVCARVEMGGGAVVLRAVRGGYTAYRAGLVSRKEDTIDLARASELVAAWVDEDSAGGFLLARSFLKQKHRLDAVTSFKRVLFTGNYVASLEAVVEKKADIASIFVSSERATFRTTLDEVDRTYKEKLRVFATTGETQTDGVVIAPGVSDEISTPVLEAFLEIAGDSSGGNILKRCFGCQELKRSAPKKTSSALQDLISFNERERARR